MKRSHKRLLLVSLAVLCIGLMAGGLWLRRRGNIPFIARQQQWTIGIVVGDSPLALTEPSGLENPVLTAKDVTDIPAQFVADPFMCRNDGTWYMFFEVMNANTGHGDIGLATSSDGFDWRYEQIVLDEPFYLSFPCVVQDGDRFCMIPESRTDGVRLYRAESFPHQWVYVTTIAEGYHADPSVFRYEDSWWMFAEAWRDGSRSLRLYFADQLQGPWAEHPTSPVRVNDMTRSRPAGRTISLENRVIRFAQDCSISYGHSIVGVQVNELSRETYREDAAFEEALLKTAWNTLGTHHLDAHLQEDGRWLGCADGYRRRVLRIGRGF